MNDFLCIVPFVNRIDLLRKAIYSVKELDPEIFDNSDGRDIGYIEGFKKWNPTVPLTFAQTMNWMTDAAYTLNRKYLLMMHSDAEAAPGVGRKLLELCRAGGYPPIPKNYEGKVWIGKPWGAIFTAYDAFVAFNIDACMAVGPWDVNLPWYFADNDYYRRLRLAGYSTLESGLEVRHEPSQTLGADARLRFLNGVTFPLYRQYYVAKWGGEPGRETYAKPFDGRCPE